MDSASSNMVLIYRLFIKVINTVSPNINLKNGFPKDKRGETMVFQINSSKANISVPQTLKWEEIDTPSVWKITNTIPKRLPESKLQ